VAETKEEIKETEKATEKETEAAKSAYKRVDDVKYAKSNVNVRSGPGTSHKKIGSLKAGQKVTRIGVADNGWGVIDFSGKEGYVSGNYLVDTKPAVVTPTPTVKSEPKSEPKPEPKPEPQPEPTSPSSSGREVPSGIPSGASYVEGDDQTHTFNYSSNLPNGGSVNKVGTSFNKGEVIILGTDNSGSGFGAVYVGEGYELGFMYGPPDLEEL